MRPDRDEHHQGEPGNLGQIAERVGLSACCCSIRREPSRIVSTAAGAAFLHHSASLRRTALDHLSLYARSDSGFHGAGDLYRPERAEPAHRHPPRGSELPMFMKLLPGQYGQFCSANALIRSIGLMVGGLACGMFLDAVKIFGATPDQCYRFVPVWNLTWLICAGIFYGLLLPGVEKARRQFRALRTSRIRNRLTAPASSRQIEFDSRHG